MKLLIHSEIERIFKSIDGHVKKKYPFPSSLRLALKTALFSFPLLEWKLGFLPDITQDVLCTR